MHESAYIDSSNDICFNENVSLTVPSLPAYVSVVRLAISAMASRCGFDIEAIEDIKVAVAEAVTNAVIHSNNKRKETIKINSIFDYEKRELRIEIEDQGPGFDMRLVKTPDISRLESGGLGLFIIRSVMDDVKLHSMVGQGTSIVMVKKIGGY